MAKQKNDHYIERVTRSLARAAIIHAHKTQLARKWQLGRQLKKDIKTSLQSFRNRVIVGFAILLIVLGEFTPILNIFTTQKAYAFQDPYQLLPKSSQALADKLQLDQKSQVFNFNANYSPSSGSDLKYGGPKITATAYQDPLKGVKVTDPVNQVDFTIKPQFNLKQGQKQDNRVVYPLQNGTGWLVYTMEAGQVKEDILLRSANGDKMKLSYDLSLGDTLEAKLEQNGSVGVYGSSLPVSGTNVTTATDKDAELLKKVRQKAQKDKPMFNIPAPVVKENNKTKSDVKAHYEIQNNILTLKVEGLKKGAYPLTIDPSVYVTSAQQFMYGNNDSNIDFNVGAGLIQKGQLTGGRIPSWTTNTVSANLALVDASSTVAGGYVYVAGGSNTSTNSGAQHKVYWAQFDTNSNAIISPTPGSTGGACTNFCTNTAYDLPADVTMGSLVSYNGYLYMIGGTDYGGSANTSVYVSKIGANGEPNAWTTTTSMGTARQQFGAVAYGNRIYAVGGDSSGGGLGGVTSVESAPINPNGTLGTWTSSTSLPSTAWAHSVTEYNGYIYSAGGFDNSGNPRNTVNYIKINADGTLASSWVSTTVMPDTRATTGGNFLTAYGGYLYISGGCDDDTIFFACLGSNIKTTTYLASINADGSITNWANTGVSRAVSGAGFVAWRGALYSIGGCVDTAGFCADTLTTQVKYGVLNSDGDISLKIQSSASPVYNSPACRISTTTDCSLPIAGAAGIGRIAQAVVINNGWIYNIGGCLFNSCTTMATKTARAQINSDGSLTSWTTDAQTLATGLSSMSIAVFNNRIIIYGGMTGAGSSATFYTSALASNGSLGAWSSASGNGGIGATGRAYSFMFTRANPSSGGAGYVYVIGGCSGASGIGCSTYYTNVYKCIISTAGAISGCSQTANGTQLQLDGDPNTAGSQGLGLSAGAMYGNYIYLAGGASGSTTAQAQQDYVFYAELNSSLNIVDPTSGHSVWPYTSTDAAGTGATKSPLTQVRRRSNAYTANGYLYVIAGHDGTSGGAGQTLQDVVVGKIDQSTGNITSYRRLQDNAGSTNILTARWDLRAAGANGYVYMLGGCTVGYPPANCGTAGNQGSGSSYDGMNGVLEYAQVYNNWSGSPASYTAQSSGTLLTDRYAASSVVSNGYLYVAGGCTAVTTTDCTTYTNNVSYASIDANGSISTNWTTATNILPANRAKGCMVAQGGTLYYLGGQSATSGGSSAFSTVYYSAIGGGGAPGAWGTTTTSIPAAVAEISCATYNGRVYVVGGSNTSAVAQTSVYASPSLAAGGDITGTWLTLTGFTTARMGATAIAYGNNLYVLGGYDSTNYLLDVQYALIGSNGTVGSWANAGTLPQAVRQGGGFAANGYMYIFGGRSASTTCTANTYVAPINANPIVNKVVQQNLSPLGSWSQTSVAYSGVRHGAAAAYDGGRAYLVGGMCNGTLTTTNSVVYGTLQSQPQISRFSYAVDADDNVVPAKILMNGVDSGIGAQWLLNYKSSTTANNTWGQDTANGAVTLGTPISITAKDAGGVTQTSSRYYYIVATIDASQSFGFPEDSTRGPTVDDITLELSAAPNKRLRNGKTFTGGQQQPLDTPF